MSTRGQPREGFRYEYPSSMDEVDRSRQKPISFESAEACVFYLAETSEPYAAWLARRKFLDKHLSVVLAIEEGNQQAGSGAEKTRNAKKTRRYQDALRDLEEAIYHETLLGSMRNAAEMKFKGWQALNANERAARP